MPHADLPHLVGRVFGAPLMMARTKLDIVLDVLRPRLFGGDLADAGPAAEPDPYVVTPSGIAVVPVFGTLVNRTFGLSALSGLTSYQRLSADLARAAADPAVRGLLLDVDSNGGEAGGVFDLADQVAGLRGIKPVFAVANEACFSAAYALACGAERLYVTQTGGVGSIGVIALHRDQSGADAQAGLHYEYLSAGARKTDGNPHEPLSDSARAALQAEVDRLYGLFTAHVARCRGLTDAQVRGQEAGLTFGPDAVAAGLADRVGTLADALTDLAARVTTSRPSGRSGGAVLPSAPKGPTAMSDVAPAEATAPATTETALRDQLAAEIAAQAGGPPAEDPQALAARLRAEAAEILDLCRIAGQPGLAADFVRQGLTPAAVRTALLDARADRYEASAVIPADTTAPAGDNPLIVAIKATYRTEG